MSTKSTTDAINLKLLQERYPAGSEVIFWDYRSRHRGCFSAGTVVGHKIHWVQDATVEPVVRTRLEVQHPETGLISSVGPDEVCQRADVVSMIQDLLDILDFLDKNS